MPGKKIRLISGDNATFWALQSSIELAISEYLEGMFDLNDQKMVEMGLNAWREQCSAATYELSNDPDFQQMLDKMLWRLKSGEFARGKR